MGDCACLHAAAHGAAILLRVGTIDPRSANEAFCAGTDWLRRAAWPTWLEHGVDWERRGFRDDLELATLRSRADYRRLRVAARQIYVFCQASKHDVPRAAEAVELGIGFLRSKARQDDGGYARQFDLDGNVTDPSRDLYDHAFVLLALSSAAALLPREPLRREAHALLHYLDSRLAHPAGGYAEGAPAALPRRQNPHMHLLEAFLAAYDAFGDAVFLQRADAMVALFLHRFFDLQAGALPEYYDDALQPHTVAGRYAVEPGHHYEWIWLFDWYARRAPQGTLAAAGLDSSARLLAIADRAGINPTLGTAYDEIWNDGVLKSADSRLWPQTERLKVEWLRPGSTTAGRLAAYRALFRYFEGAPPGLWYERLRQDGSKPAEPAPASSLYHLTSCLLFGA